MKILNENLKTVDKLDDVKALIIKVKDIYIKVDKMSKSKMFSLEKVENKETGISAHTKK